MSHNAFWETCFYRGLILKAPVFLGDTLHTSTEVVALRQNTIRPERQATGMVALRMDVVNQRDERVAEFYRCPMIPCKNPEADSGHSDSFDALPDQLVLDDLRGRGASVESDRVSTSCAGHALSRAYHGPMPGG